MITKILRIFLIFQIACACLVVGCSNDGRQHTDAYLRGYSACKLGLPINGNPYSGGSVSSTQFFDGYVDAKSGIALNSEK